MSINDSVTNRRRSSTETILFLLDYAPTTWCSREDYHVAVCKALAERGVESVLVFAKPVPADLATNLRERGVVVEVNDYGKGILHYYTQLGRLVSKYSPSVAHICYFDYFSAVPWLARLQGIKTIVYEAVNSGVFTARSWKQSLLRLRNSVMTKPLTGVIAISQFVKQQLSQSGITVQKIQVRHLGVDQSRFVPGAETRQQFRSEYGVSVDEIVIASVSFLNPFKNPQTIVEACGLLAQQGVRFHLFVAGDGELRPELESLTHKLNLGQQVTWLGHIAEPRKLLQASDIFALASVGEAFGFVVTEAMGCGLPVVATVSGAFPEIVKDGETGLLVPPQDAVAFANALKKLIDDKALRASMGARGQARAKSEFGMDSVVRNTIQFYDSLNLLQKQAAQQ